MADNNSIPLLEHLAVDNRSVSLKQVTWGHINGSLNGKLTVELDRDPLVEKNVKNKYVGHDAIALLIDEARQTVRKNYDNLVHNL